MKYINDFQSRLVITLTYFTVVVPFGLLVRVFKDPLRLRRRGRRSGWVPRPASTPNLKDVRRQF
jgi:hypothetical protein